MVAEVADGLHRGVFVLADEHHRVAGGFLVGADGHERLLVGADAVGLFLARVLLGGDVAEHRLDLGFHLGHVDVADYDDGLEIRTVPIVIEVLDDLVVEGLQDVEFTDGHTVGVAGVLHEDRPVLLAHTVVGAEAEAVFLDDDTALLVNLLVVVEQTGGPAAEDLETEVDVTGIVGRHRNHIDGLVEAGVGVEVSAEHHALAAQVVHHAVAREALDAVEGHVLGEVRQALLVVVLLVGAGVHRETELHAVFRVSVPTDVIGQTVVQFPDGHIRVRLDGVAQVEVALLREHGQRAEQGHHKQKYFLHKRLFY